MIRLHGYWRSSASYRVRIALNLKGIAYEQETHDLRRGEQNGTGYAALNPQQLVPALETDEGVLIQSPAILEWLEERYPKPALLPAAAHDRAVVRSMAAVIGCDVHPLNNLRVLNALRRDFAAGEEQVQAWIGGWIVSGFTALEDLIARHGEGFAYGAKPTLADCYVVPQVYSAERFGVDLTPFPRIVAAAALARGLPAFASADPGAQPDADPA